MGGVILRADFAAGSSSGRSRSPRAPPRRLRASADRLLQTPVPGIKTHVSIHTPGNNDDPSSRSAEDRTYTSARALTRSAEAHSRPPAAPTCPRRPNAATLERGGDLAKRFRPGGLRLRNGRCDDIGEGVGAGRVVRVGDCVGSRMAAGGSGRTSASEAVDAAKAAGVYWHGVPCVPEEGAP